MMAVGSTINLILSVFGISVSSIFIIFWCARFLCSQLINGRRPPGTFLSRLAFSGRVVERNMTGVSPLMISRFPTVIYNQDLLASRQEFSCAICLGEYKEGEILRFLPQCIHMFHVNCIDAWLQQHSTCPVCRLSLQDAASSMLQPNTHGTTSSEQLTNLLEIPPAMNDNACERDDVENLTNQVYFIGQNAPSSSSTVSASRLRTEGMPSSEQLNSDLSEMPPGVISCMNETDCHEKLQATLGLDEPGGLAFESERHEIIEDIAVNSGIDKKESHVVDLEPPE
eukprot:c27398_g1_i1 orf=145-993(+)